MHNVSLRHPDLPFSGGSSIGDWRGDGGASVHSKLPCEDAVLLCSLPRSQTKPPSAVSVCCSLSGGSQHNCRRTGKISDFSFRRACCVNPLHLANKVVGKAFPLDPLKRRFGVKKGCAYSPPQPLFAPSPPHGKDQNHCAPCFTDCIARSALAFFAVLSLTPVSSIRSMISRCAFGPSARS